MRFSSRARRVLCVPAAIAVVAVVAGCRVPDDASPREIPSDQVPFDLLASSTTSPPATSPIPTVDGMIYLQSGKHLVAVKRSVPAPLTIGSLLAALVQGATKDESVKGYTSSVGPQASVLSAQVLNGSAVIDISDSFSGIGVQEQIAGLAQIVYTATEIPGVQNVRIQLNAHPANVLRGDGSATTEPLTPTDYPAFAPQ